VLPAVVLLFWLLKQPSRMSVSLLLDDRLRLHERFSTTLALAGSQDPFAAAARAEAYETARRIDPRTHFPIKLSRWWMYGAGTWVIVVVLVLFMPQKDLLGFLRKQKQQEERTKQVELAKSDVEKKAGQVKSTLEQLGRPDLADDLAALDQIPQAAKPTEIKREAIRRLSDLSDKVKQLKNSTEFESVKLMEQMLRQLRGSPDAFSQKLRMTLAQGNFSQASKLLQQMQKELTEGKLSDEQRKALNEQLQELAKQIKALAAKNEELEKELEKLGLEKSLSKMDEKQLRQALQNKGLSADKIEQLLQKAAACSMACGKCAGLGEAMGACGSGAGGLSGDDLASVMDQLDALETMKQQVMLTQAALDQIMQACAGLGQGMCEGLGGIGYGERATDKDGQTSTKTTKVQNDPRQGPVVASWYVKGTQIKGEAKRDFTQVIQAARDNAAEAISENQVPRKYEEAVKKYFGELEQSDNK
jgi:hypothetical protein